MAELTKYDPSLEATLSPDPGINEIFSDPTEIGGGSVPGVDAIFESVGAEDDFAGITPSQNHSSIFKAALDTSKKRQSVIPAYARDLLSQLKEAEEEEEDDEKELPEEGEESSGEEIDLDAGDGEDSFDFFSEEDSEEDEEAEEEEDEEFSDPDDLVQTAEWDDESVVNSELSKIMKGSEPAEEGAPAVPSAGGYGQSQHRPRPFSSTGVKATAAYDNTVSAEGTVDNELTRADAFSSGGFIEEFEDGFVFVDRGGQTVALAVPELEDEYYGAERYPTDSAAVLLVKGSGEEDPEMAIELSGEELESLSALLSAASVRTVGATAGKTLGEATKPPNYTSWPTNKLKSHVLQMRSVLVERRG